MVLTNQNNYHNQVSPFVLWGQDDKVVTLKIELRNVESPIVNLDENRIRFQSYGVGQQGANYYEFEFDFFDSIDAKTSVFKINESCIDFLIRKRKHEIWPRLTLNKLRRAWLKVNFEKSYWNEVDDENPFDRLKNEELEFYQRTDLSRIGNGEQFFNSQELTKRMDLAGKSINRVEFMRRFYLLLYNLIQLYGSVYLLTILLLRYDGSNVYANACRDMQSTINFLCYVKLFEIPHQVFGFVFDKDRTVWYLVLNRLFIFCVLIEFEARLIVKPAVYYLVILYAIFDITNYLYYMLRTLDIDSRLMRWIRCTIWIPIYPLIFLLEAVILLRSLPYYSETKRLTLELPNQLNISFPFVFAFRIYVFFIFTPVMYFTMNNFYKHRLKQLTGERQGKKQA